MSVSVESGCVFAAVEKHVCTSSRVSVRVCVWSGRLNVCICALVEDVIPNKALIVSL